MIESLFVLADILEKREYYRGTHIHRLLRNNCSRSPPGDDGPSLDPWANRGPATNMGNTEISNVVLLTVGSPTQRADLSTEPTVEQRRVIERFGSISEAHASTLRARDRDEAEPKFDTNCERRLGALGYR